MTTSSSGAVTPVTSRPGDVALLVGGHDGDALDRVDRLAVGPLGDDAQQVEHEDDGVAGGVAGRGGGAGAARGPGGGLGGHGDEDPGAQGLPDQGLDERGRGLPLDERQADGGGAEAGVQLGAVGAGDDGVVDGHGVAGLDLLAVADLEGLAGRLLEGEGLLEGDRRLLAEGALDLDVLERGAAGAGLAPLPRRRRRSRRARGRRRPRRRPRAGRGGRRAVRTEKAHEHPVRPHRR